MLGFSSRGGVQEHSGRSRPLFRVMRDGSERENEEVK